MEPFTINNLDEAELGHWEYITRSPSYTDFVRPFLEGCLKMYTDLILDPRPHVRRQHGGTKYLRAGANNIRKMLEFMDSVVAEAQDDRSRTAREGRDSLSHKELVERGIIKAAGVVMDEYGPDEEF